MEQMRCMLGIEVVVKMYTGMPSRGGRLRPRKIAMTATSTAATSTAATAAYGHSQWMLMSFVVISATFP